MRWLGARGALVLAAVLAACGDDDASPDSGLVPARPIDPEQDAGAGFCEPLGVPDFTFVPPPAFQGLCTNAQIEALLTSCLFEGGGEADCEAAVRASETCFDCVFGTFDSVPARPLALYSEEAPPRPSTGTCLSNLTGDTDPKGCAVAFGQVETCAFLACTHSCVGGTNAQQAACVQKALGSVCKKGFDIFDSPTCAQTYADRSLAPCTEGQTSTGVVLSNLEYYRLVTRLACGPAPSPVVPDAGPDASADADAGDLDAGSDADAN